MLFHCVDLDEPFGAVLRSLLELSILIGDIYVFIVDKLFERFFAEFEIVSHKSTKFDLISMKLFQTLVSSARWEGIHVFDRQISQQRVN